MRRLDPAYRARFADGSTIHVRHGREAMRHEIAEHLRLGRRGRVRRLRGLAAGAVRDRDAALHRPQLRLTARPAPRPRRRRAAGPARRLRPARRPPSADGSRDPRLHRLFSFQAMYAGLAPDDALAIYAVITYMDSIEGVWFPDGGMHAMPVALATAAEKAGAEFALRRPRSPRSSAVATPAESPAYGWTSGEQIAADAVVCTLDLPDRVRASCCPICARRAPSATTALLAVGGGLARRRPRTARPGGRRTTTSTSARVGERLRRPAEAGPADAGPVPAGHHPLAWTTRPWRPAGCSTLYVLEPVPNLVDGRIDWSREARADAGAAARLPGRARAIPTDVVTEELVTPLEWERQGMAAGTPFALAHTFAQTGPFRPPNVERTGAGADLRRLRHRPRGRGADGADLREAGRRSGRRVPPGRCGQDTDDQESASWC